MNWKMTVATEISKVKVKWVRENKIETLIQLTRKYDDMTVRQGTHTTTSPFSTDCVECNVYLIYITHQLYLQALKYNDEPKIDHSSRWEAKGTDSAWQR